MHDWTRINVSDAKGGSIANAEVEMWSGKAGRPGFRDIYIILEYIKKNNHILLHGSYRRHAITKMSVRVGR